MRYLELIGRPPSAAPRFFRLVADSGHVEEARLPEWNPSTEDALTALYVIDGDADAFRSELDHASVIVEFELTRVEDGRFYLLVVGRPLAAPLFQQVTDAVTWRGLIVATPVVYREGTVRFRIVGPADMLQSMVEAVPPGESRLRSTRSRFSRMRRRPRRRPSANASGLPSQRRWSWATITRPGKSPTPMSPSGSAVRRTRRPNTSKKPKRSSFRTH